MSESSRRPGPVQSSARRQPRVDEPRLRPDPAMPRHQRRLIRAIRGTAEHILSPDEEIVAVTEAVEDGSRVTRVVLGAAWAPCQRVALVFTGRRLIEMALSSSGRRSRGRVRSFPWDGIPSFQIVDDRLEVKTWDDEIHTWYLRDVPDPEIEGRLNRRVNLAVSTFVPSGSRTAPLRHCTKCGTERPSTEESCRVCGATLRTAHRASQLALATPGGGHFYAGRPLGGAVRLLLESSIFAVLAFQVLGTTNPWRVAAVVAAGCGLLGLVKLQSAWSARLLATRAAAITDRAKKFWRWVVPMGLAVSIFALLSPLAMVGALESSVDWDLSFIDSVHGWHRITPELDDDLNADMTVRAVWSDPAGRKVVLRGWPFPPFQSATRAHRELVRRVDGETTPGLIGEFPVVLAQRRTAEGDLLVSSLVVDPTGRDVHSLSVVAEPGREDEARDLLKWLLDRGVMISTRDPD